MKMTYDYITAPFAHTGLYGERAYRLLEGIINAASNISWPPKIELRKKGKASFASIVPSMVSGGSHLTVGVGVDGEVIVIDHWFMNFSQAYCILGLDTVIKIVSYMCDLMQQRDDGDGKTVFELKTTRMDKDHDFIMEAIEETCVKEMQCLRYLLKHHKSKATKQAAALYKDYIGALVGNGSLNILETKRNEVIVNSTRDDLCAISDEFFARVKGADAETVKLIINETEPKIKAVYRSAAKALGGVSDKQINRATSNAMRCVFRVF